MTPLTGTCALCRKTGELRNSHLVPKALYRLARASYSRSNPNPVFLTADGRQQTSFQAFKYLLCANCETRFDRKGEAWVMRHCYRGRGRFRVRDLLEQSKPIHVDDENAIYNAASVPGFDVEKITYFCVSVFWRAAVCSWESSRRTYMGINLGKKYQEQIRTYLMGEAPFPESGAILLLVSSLTRPAVTFNFPDTIRVDSSHVHTLHIPGLTFQLSLGKDPSAGVRESCLVRSEWHPIFVCKDGDTRAQRNVLRLMGKKAPSWATYPTIEGVV